MQTINGFSLMWFAKSFIPIKYLYVLGQEVNVAFGKMISKGYLV